MKVYLQKAMFILIFAVAAFFGMNLGQKPVKAAGKWYRGKYVTVRRDGCDFRAYLSDDGKESWIFQIIITKDKLKKLTFPKEVENAPVTRVGYGDELYEEDSDCIYSIFETVLEPWHNGYRTDEKAESITSIEFPETLTRIDTGAFCGLKKLKKINIPDGVEELSGYAFAACSELTEVKLPAGLKKFGVSAFEKCKAIKKLSVPSGSTMLRTKKGYLLTKDSKKLVWAPPARKKISIPAGVTELGFTSLIASQAKEITIPKSVRKIEGGALSGEKIEKVVLKKGNKVYRLHGGCIYKKADKSLTAILVKKRWARVSSKVKVLGDGISVMGVRVKKINRVDIPKSVKSVTGEWEFFNGFSCSALVYFHGKTPPRVIGKNTHIPSFNKIYVPKKAKKAYIRWAKDHVINVKSWIKDYLNTF